MQASKLTFLELFPLVDMTIIFICFSCHLEAFLIISKRILTTFRGFVTGVLCEAKKRKINSRGKDLLL